MQETEIKYFSPKGANQTLPLVKQIVKDILKAGYEIRTISDSLGGSQIQNEETKKLYNEIDGYIQELLEIGCYYKDWQFSVGLVDFPAIIDDKEVYLCWRTDEESVLYYHDIESGYRGRKLIPESYFS